MNEHFESFVDCGRRIAQERNINWSIEATKDGMAQGDSAWNLTALIGGTPPPVHWFRDLGTDEKALAAINSRRIKSGLTEITTHVLSRHWLDFIKASILEQLFYRKNTTGYVLQVVRPLRTLATCAVECEPWELLPEHILAAKEIASEIQASGKLADLIVGITKTLIDANHIANFGQLYPALSVARMPGKNRKSKFTKSTDELRANLEERKHAEKLPENKAFWELTRIVFTESPRSFLDFLRFAQIKAMLLCGLRIGEVCLLPNDWKRTRSYYDPTGRPAGEVGGHSTSLMLRHFAEKQQSENSDSTLLYETAQYVPEIFVESLSNTLDQVSNATGPLRRNLQRQIETGRILPWFGREECVSVIELYTYLTGNPVLVDLPDGELTNYRNRYLSNFDPGIFDEMRKSQLLLASAGKLNMAVYQFLNRLKGKITFRHANGSECRSSRMSWGSTFFRIDEAEDYIAREMTTKLSDTGPFWLSNESRINPWDLMFLMPKRALAEGRNGGLCDIGRHYGIGRSDTVMTSNALVPGSSTKSIFEEYGSDEEDKNLSLNSHSLRHLQNTELFRLGVADTIITKRFNRRSVAQSYVYDHRSLAEELAHIDLPPDIEVALGDRAATVARMIISGKANGPIVSQFKEIQRNEGEDAAFDYLKVEADGFHSTPYGHCLNSFTVDPCPKHLECFSGCRHISATNLPENRRNLIVLEKRIQSALVAAEQRPEGTVGRANQITHARRTLAGVRTLLSSPVGEPVFPDGPDFSVATSRQLDIFDDQNGEYGNDTSRRE